MPTQARKLPLRGNLKILTRHGRRGPFKVGVLRTPIYTFAVKDVALEQFDAGAYDGEFVIDRIYVHFYPTGSGGGFEIRAVLADMRLFDFEQSNDGDQPAPMEPDPADEEEEAEQFSIPSKPAKPISHQANQGSRRSTSTESAAERASDEDSPAEQPHTADTPADDTADKTLFGTLWPLPDRVKLDATVGRLRFRSQCTRLWALGYKPNHRTQEWYQEAA